MMDILEIPSGEILEIDNKTFLKLKDYGLILYISEYKNQKVSMYCYYDIYKSEILDFMDRTNIDDFNKKFK